MAEPHIIGGMLALLNEANAALPTDGEIATDVLAVCQQWFTDQDIPYECIDGQYVLLPQVQAEE